ncbi:MAG: PAS domain-containing sensor histidine kinase, partial [Candidatus Saliniplasma sp.]
QKGGDPTSQYGVLAQAIKQEVRHYETETIRKENDERYRRLFETAQDGMLILNAETGKIKNANPYIQKILGYSKKELVGEKLWETRPFKDLFENRKGFEELVEKGYIRYEELPLKTKDWDEKPVEFVSITYQAGEEIEVQCNIRDISERKRLVDELNKRSEAMEASIDGMAILSEDEEYIYLNNAHAEIYGYDDPDELLGKTWSVLYDEEELKKFKDEIMPMFWEKGRWKGEVIGKKKDGTKFPQELSLSALEDGGLICVVRDISERKEAEEREEFLHSLLRHDVKNKTQIVKGYIQLLKEYEELSDQAKGYIRKAEKATEASDKIIEKVKKLKQIEQEDEIEEVDIDSVLDQVLSEHENELEKEGIDIEVNTSGCKVKGGILLQEAISNLVENSILHSDCDQIRIKARCDRNGCIVTVEDDGRGIPYDIQEKIFDRGFKQGENAGTRLGTYLVKQIVESYGGSVEVKDSELGGARFDVRLKRAQ